MLYHKHEICTADISSIQAHGKYDALYMYGKTLDLANLSTQIHTMHDMIWNNDYCMTLSGFISIRLPTPVKINLQICSEK